MRVLQVCPYFHPAHIYGGPIPVLYDLCNHLAVAGCDVKVLTTTANGRSTLDVPTNEEVRIGNGFSVRYCRRIGGDATAPAMLAHIWRMAAWADVVHLSNVYSFPTLPVLAACRILRKPLVWSPMGSLQRWKGSRRVALKAKWDGLCRLLVPPGFVLHVTSAREAVESRRIYARAKLAVIPHGVSVPPQIPPRRAAERMRLLFIGRLDPKKGIENLLDALHLLRTQAEARPWTAVLAGSGEPDYVDGLRRRIAELGLTDKVTMPGLLTGEAKERLFADSDVALVPSHMENFAMVVPEALARGVAVIAGTRTPWQDMERAGCGLWVENDAASLAAAILRIGRMDWIEMGLRGRRWVQENFDWRDIAERTIQLYRECIGRRPGEARFRQAHAGERVA